MEQQDRDLNKPIRFVILGTPYTIKPTEELTSEAISKLVDYVKSLVESYLRRGFDETKGSIARPRSTSLMKSVAFKKSYELPLPPDGGATPICD